VPGAKHLWVGEPYVRIALSEIVRRVNPAALVPPTMTLPTQYVLGKRSRYAKNPLWLLAA